MQYTYRDFSKSIVYNNIFQIQTFNVSTNHNLYYNHHFSYRRLSWSTNILLSATNNTQHICEMTLALISFLYNKQICYFFLINLYHERETLLATPNNTRLHREIMFLFRCQREEGLAWYYTYHITHFD